MNEQERLRTLRRIEDALAHNERAHSAEEQAEAARAISRFPVELRAGSAVHQGELSLGGSS